MNSMNNTQNFNEPNSQNNLRSKNRLLIGETLNNTTNLRGELEANVGGNSTSNMNTSQTRFKTRSQSKPTNSQAGLPPSNGNRRFKDGMLTEELQ